MFDEDLKSPKKRQKISGTPTKTEIKTESNISESADGKKKVRKIFKKSEENEDADGEGEDCTTTSKEVSKFYAANHSNIIKRKGPSATDTLNDEASETSNEDKDKAKKIPDESPKKRQPKTFGPAVAAATTKTTDSKTESTTDTESKKKARKVFNKKIDDFEEKDESDSDSKELIKFLSNCSGSRALSRKDTFAKSAIETDDADENSNSDGKEKVKKVGNEDTKNIIKRLTPSKKRRLIGASANKADSTAPDTSAESKKKQVVRRALLTGNKKLGEPDDADNSESDDLGEPPGREQTKYFSHYSGPKTKAAAALAADSENAQNILKAEAQMTDSSKFSSSTNTSSQDESKSKTIEPVAQASSSVESKQGPSADKKLITTASAKVETKTEPKVLDFTPTTPHSVPVPAPISARLPATASIEEKLSAAAVFRSKQKDVKKEEEIEITPRKIIKEVIKKVETVPVKKIKEETKVKHEPEKKKQHSADQVIVKKDPLQEIELRKDPLLEVMKKKDDEVSKTKKDPDLKTTVSTLASSVTKTYGAQKKEPTAKLEDSWKKNLPSISTEQADLPCNEPVKDFGILRKETIISKIKSSIERDSIDSTDSSDSERRLTIIDSEDFPEDKCNDSGSDVKTKNSNVTIGQCHYTDHPTAVQKDLVQHVFGMMQGKSAKTEEDGENMNSLLCEEEIPGSPTPCNETADQEHRSASAQNVIKTDMGKLTFDLLDFFNVMIFVIFTFSKQNGSLCRGTIAH